MRRRSIAAAQRGSAQSTNELVLRHMGFVSFRLHRKVFPELLRRFGEELLAEAIPVLYTKVQTYDLAYRDRAGQLKPVKFVSYIWKRIDGHILDGLRRELEHDKALRPEGDIPESAGLGSASRPSSSCGIGALDDTTNKLYTCS